MKKSKQTEMEIMPERDEIGQVAVRIVEIDNQIIDLTRERKKLASELAGKLEKANRLSIKLGDNTFKVRNLKAKKTIVVQ